ncbi:hypothetical protein STEG23_027735, partial [Scotinomys teguina]
MARKAGQGKEEEESRARQQEEKTPVREEEKTPACDGRGHHIVEQGDLQCSLFLSALKHCGNTDHNMLSHHDFQLDRNLCIVAYSMYAYSKKNYIGTMYICCLARTWKQPRCPSTEEWIRKMWYIYTMEYYAAEKNNDIMKFAGKWMELENVILSE